MPLLDWLSVPFELPFMARALTVLALMAVISAVVGVFINLRGLEFTSDGLVHAVFPGIVIGFAVAGRPGLYVGAAIAGAIGAVLLTLISRRAAASDSATAIILTGMFSVGVLIVSTREDFAPQLESLLFGRLLTVRDEDVIQTVIVVLIAAALIAITFRGQLYRAFDPVGAKAIGYRVLALDLSLNVAIALVVVAASNAIGNLLVLAVLIVPAAVGRLVTRRLGGVFLTALLFSLLASVAGLLIAFHLSTTAGVNVPAGSTVVLVFVAGYLLVAIVRFVADRAARPRAAAVSGREAAATGLASATATNDEPRVSAR